MEDYDGAGVVSGLRATPDFRATPILRGSVGGMRVASEAMILERLRRRRYVEAATLWRGAARMRQQN